MKIQSITNTNFSSLKYPIKPFKLNTSKGCVSCCEINYLKSLDSKNLKQLGEFFLDNFAASSSHPFWKLCQKKNKFFNKHVYNDYLRNDICKKIKNNLINPDSTIMIGKNNKNEIVAAIVTTPFEHKENSLYIDMLAVSKKYRGNHIAEKFIEEVCKASMQEYQETFLVSYKEVDAFYKKLGFNDIKENWLIKILRKERKDYPKYASFLKKN